MKWRGVLRPGRVPALRIETPEELGDLVFGPALFAFLAWLLRHPATTRLDRLYFLSREGWLLRRLYEAMAGATAGAKAGPWGIGRFPEAVYLHASRRALLAARLGASLADGEALDMRPLTDSSPWFAGSVEELLRARIGFVPRQPGAAQSSRIVLTRDAEVVQCVAGLLEDEIAPHVRQARDGFIAYAGALGMLDGGKAGLVDVGYSATIQSAIQKTLSRTIPRAGFTGFYMAVTPAARRVASEGGHAFGAFAQGEAAAAFGSAYGLLLESVLTAPHGQVTGYGPSGAPLFEPGGVSQDAFAVLERVHAGILAHCLRRLAQTGLAQNGLAQNGLAQNGLAPIGLEPEADPLAMLRQLGSGAILVTPEIRAALSVEDAFCGNGEIAVLGTRPGDTTS